MKHCLMVIVFSLCVFCGCYQYKNTYENYDTSHVTLQPRKNMSICFVGDHFDNKIVTEGISNGEVYLETKTVENADAEFIREYFEKLGYNVRSNRPEYIITLYPGETRKVSGKGWRALAYWGTFGVWQMQASYLTYRVKINDCKTGVLLYDKCSPLVSGERGTIVFIPFPIIPFGLFVGNAYYLSWQLKAIEDALNSLSK